MDIVGERILLARRRQGIAQKDLAARIGMSGKHLSQVETGVKHGLHLRADFLIRLAQTLGVSADYLLGMDSVDEADTAPPAPPKATRVARKAAVVQAQEPAPAPVPASAPSTKRPRTTTPVA
jgi:transcriptional regulator with XRE-family HTH domain